jgi:hypothetical protein
VFSLKVKICEMEMQEMSSRRSSPFTDMRVSESAHLAKYVQRR